LGNAWWQRLPHTSSTGLKTHQRLPPVGSLKPGGVLRSCSRAAMRVAVAAAETRNSRPIQSSCDSARRWPARQLASKRREILFRLKCRTSGNGGLIGHQILYRGIAETETPGARRNCDDYVGAASEAGGQGGDRRTSAHAVIDLQLHGTKVSVLESAGTPGSAIGRARAHPPMMPSPY